MKECFENNYIVYFNDVFNFFHIISGVQISFRRLTKVGVTSKFWLKLTDVKRYCRKVGDLSTT